MTAIRICTVRAPRANGLWVARSPRTVHPRGREVLAGAQVLSRGGHTATLAHKHGGGAVRALHLERVQQGVAILQDGGTWHCALSPHPDVTPSTVPPTQLTGSRLSTSAPR